MNTSATHQWIERLQKSCRLTEYTFEDSQIIAPHLGAKYQNGQTKIGFWLPELKEKGNLTPYLEVFSAEQPIDFQQKNTTIDFKVSLLPMVQIGEFAFCIVEGMKAGNAHQAGDFYCVSYTDGNGQKHRIFDALAYSIPFGAFSPAELYDMDEMFHNRKDKVHFERIKSADIQRFETPVNILQLHPHTATATGSLAGISRLFDGISTKIKNNQPLSKAEKCYANYDGIQLLPIMPQIEKEKGERFFHIKNENNGSATVELRAFDIQNWGYDIVIAAASAVNPSLLESRRPHELLELIETLHHFEGKPKKVVLDIVYGHSDNQAQQILNRHFFLGGGMYGQEMNVRHPMVRAIMLESQRRIGNYGVDGFRVDAAQDIIYKDENGNKQYDNDYLHLMNDMVYEAAGVPYKMWMVFEDGRPWPKPDWNIATTYKEVYKMIPNALQWGPLTFVNNKPLIFGFWIERFWRVQQIARTGQMWVTGGSNHDTYRGLAQMNPSETSYNTNLGNSLRKVAFKGYNNPAARLLDHGFLPGVPMEFINASTDTPWGFLRNTDYHWGVKVFADEVHFFDWFVDKNLYADGRFFQRLKKLGFHQLQQVVAFKNALRQAVRLTDYNLQKIVEVLRMVSNGKFPVANGRWELRQMALAYMEDAYDFCNVSHHIDQIAEDMAQFNYEARAFRLQRPQLLDNLKDSDTFAYWHSPDGAVVYYGTRQMANGEELLFVGNMEGAAAQIDLVAFNIPNFNKNGWRLALKTPNCSAVSVDDFWLNDSEAVVFVR